MNLLCPNCQKMLQVPEQYAGQLMKCPLCAGTFTVPALPTPPAPPPPPPAPPPPPPVQTAPAPMERSSAPARLSAPAAPAAGYTHTRSFELNGKTLTWVAPISLLLVFILSLPFFNWAGMYPGGIPGLTQSAWGVAFDHQSTDEVFRSKIKKGLESAPGDRGKELEFLTKDGSGDLGVGIWMILFVLFTIPAVLAALASALIHLKMIPVQLPPSMDPLLQYRPLLVSAFALLLLVLLGMQMLSGFPLEAKVHSAAVSLAKDTDSTKDPGTNEERQTRKMIEGAIEGMANLDRGWPITLSLLLLVIAILGGLLEFSVVRRGNAPPFRVDIQY